MSYSEIPSETNRISSSIIGLAIKVHTTLGPGLLESVYKECLFYEISKANYSVEKEVCLPLIYEDIKFEAGYRADLFVSDQLIVEVKSVDALTDVHTAQVLTYLKLSGCRVGLLINFNVGCLKNGLKRLVL